MRKFSVGLLLIGFAFTVKGQERDTSAKVKNDTSQKWIAVDVIPQFPGGEFKFYQYLTKNLKYPKDDKKNNIGGKVFVTFVIEKDGSLTDIHVTKSLSLGADAEAIRLITTSPKWVPGMANGVPCRVKYTVPVSFRLDQ